MCNTSSICYQDQSPRNEQTSITITLHKKHTHRHAESLSSKGLPQSPSGHHLTHTIF